MKAHTHRKIMLMSCEFGLKNAQEIFGIQMIVESLMDLIRSKFQDVCVLIFI